MDLTFCDTTALIRNVINAASIGSSDHASVLFRLNLRKASHRFFLKRDFAAAEYSMIRRYFAEVDWIGFLYAVETVGKM